jgi:tetratricopeptide (TPR) repeat protein
MPSPATTVGRRAPADSSHRPANTERQPCPRWFWPTLLAICLVGGVLRFLVREQYLATNPVAISPTVDALTYWEWAGRIAGGQLSDRLPFFSAPLYPYLLGLLRACGGGLPTVYTVQILLDLVTAVLLAWIARLRFGPLVGVLAAAIFLLMLEPASFALRVLSATLQLSLVCLVWLALLSVQRQPSLLRSILAGAALGLLALAYAPALLGLPIVALWRWANAGWSLVGLGRAAAGIAAGLVVIAPATIHNYWACAELIPISAQAGVTFAQGNAPGAQGVYTPIPGVSIRRDAQHYDTFRIYRQVTGQTPTWRAVNRFFFERGFEHWRSDLSRAARLFARKAYWFVTGQHYGDICQPTMEIAEGFTTRLRLLPLRTAWLIPAALVALVAWLRRFNRYLPELMLFGIPLLVVLVFWYSPRYRFPAVPVIVVGTSWLLGQALRWRQQPGWTVTFVAAVAVGVGLGFVNRAVGFDPLEPYRAMFYNTLGTAAARVERFEDAAGYHAKALELEPGYAEAAANLGSALARLGQPDAGLQYRRRAVDSAPDNAFFRESLGRALVA